MTRPVERDEIQRATIEVIGPVDPEKWQAYKNELGALLDKYRKQGVNLRVRRLLYMKKADSPEAEFR